MQQIVCWRCRGKCLVYGWAVAGDPKESWYDCPTCQGKGWLAPPKRPEPPKPTGMTRRHRGRWRTIVCASVPPLIPTKEQTRDITAAQLAWSPAAEDPWTAGAHRRDEHGGAHRSRHTPPEGSS
jgi:hypothetical protein